MGAFSETPVPIASMTCGGATTVVQRGSSSTASPASAAATEKDSSFLFCGSSEELASDEGESTDSSRTDETLLEEDDAPLILTAASSALESDSTGNAQTRPCFRGLRFKYLSVILVIYLADGMQGMHDSRFACVVCCARCGLLS